MNVRLFLLLAACLCLAGLAFSYLLVARAQERKRRFEQRLRVALRHGRRPAAAEAANLLRTTAPGARRTPAERIATLVGADLARTDLYHVAWWLVPVLSLAPAWVVTLLAQSLAGPAATLAFPAACVFIPRKYFAMRHASRVAALFAQFPDALATVVRAVRVGIPVSEAIRAVANEAAEPTRSEFARLAADVAIGSPLDEALRAMAERNHVPEYRFFATALSLQANTGGAIGETLENLADVIRKRVAARARGKALAAEARTSALVLSVLPAVAGVGLWVINPGYIGVLFVTETGHTILAAAAGLLGFGTFVMRTMIRRSLT